VTIKTATCLAQEASVFNLNADNGLPSNHIYGMITDKFGYLWISTDKGVVRYNGYECKEFGIAEGLPTDDIWELLEDKKGRIWLVNISEEIGYIYNEKYHKAHLKGVKGTLYPKSIYPYGNGVIFYSETLNQSRYPTICVVKNDTLLPFLVDNKLIEPYELEGKADPIFINSLGDVHIVLDSNLYRLTNLNSLTNSKSNLHFQKMYKLRHGILDYLSTHMQIMAGKYIISYLPNKKSNILFVLNPETGNVDTVDLKTFDCDEPIEFANSNRSYNNAASDFNIFTKSHILNLQLNANKIKVKTIPALSIIKRDDADTKLVSYIKNNFWNACIGTTTMGGFILLNDENQQFKKIDCSLSGCRYVGGKSDEISFWWNIATRKLYKVEKDKITAKFSMPELQNINKIVNIKENHFDLLSTYWHHFNSTDGKITAPVKPIDVSNVLTYIIDTPGHGAVLSRHGLYQFGPLITAKGKIFDFIDNDSYRDMTFDSLNGYIWIYNNNTILVYKDERKLYLRNDQLGQLGITRLDNICIDGKYGNVFLKSARSLYLFDLESKSAKELFDYINLANTQVTLHGNILIISGSFGILFCKILGKGKLSQPVIYNNTKKIRYKKSVDLVVSAGKLLLNTDNGVYETEFPSDSAYYTASKKNVAINYKIIAKISGSQLGIKNGDTIVIEQNDRKVLFDVINPNGSGRISYFGKTYTDSGWQQLTGGETNIPESYAPDDYHRLVIYAADDAWKSDNTVLTIYVRPFWWQTHTAITFIWIVTILLGVAIVATAIIITRRQVLKASLRKNLQMEMELKSIHAQINPHFIFNSLNSALLLVNNNRMEEAYAHISKFSKLLRSYLKSSRNKYITIGEEIVNLRNYVELQQTRFKNKFTYEIIVDPELNQNSIKIPSLLLQPFVENAINHGILEKQEQGRLKINFNLKGKNEIICTIEDDGIGRIQSRINKTSLAETEESYGNLMIKDLVNIFNKYEDIHIDIAYIDKESPLTGTAVVITIKNLKHG
jgi:hypothetical protein